MDYLKKINEIIGVLSQANETGLIKKIKNGLIMGGTHGEKLMVVCSLLKTYETFYPDVFSIIENQAQDLFNLAEGMSQSPRANLDLLKELE